jgi:hypothetical protein
MSFAEIVRKRFAELRPKWWLFGQILLIAFLASIVSAVAWKPTKTNGMYLDELIESRTLEKTAMELISRLRSSPETKDFTQSDWQQMESGLSLCLVKQAKAYAASSDPYLSVRANKETPTILANRFLKACGALD